MRDHQYVAGERWDVLDPDGRPTGDAHERGAGNLPLGRFHLVATVCVVRSDGAVLLTRRAAGREFAGSWELPGGSALAEETSRQAAVRELAEETGLRSGPEELYPVGRCTEPGALVDLYVVRFADPVLELQEQEVAEAEWVELPDVGRRRRAGLLAAPWEGRLNALEESLTSVLAAITR